MITLPGVPPSEEVIRQFSGGRHLLAFSCGKDAIAAWLALRDKVDVLPFYMELVPGLEFVEESLAYYERFFGQKILRVPNPSFYRMLYECVFQCPQHWHQILRWPGVPMFSHQELHDYIARSHNLNPAKTWTALGVRAADSIVRRAHFRKHGAVIQSNRKFYPVWDWQIHELIAVMKGANCKLPADYRIFGRSFDGLDFRFLKPIHDHYPRDYQRILEWFPMAELELIRHQFSKSV